MKKLYKSGRKSSKKSSDGMYAMTSRTFDGKTGSTMVSGYTMKPADGSKKSKTLKVKKKG